MLSPPRICKVVETADGGGEAAAVEPPSLLGVVLRLMVVEIVDSVLEGILYAADGPIVRKTHKRMQRWNSRDFVVIGKVKSTKRLSYGLNNSINQVVDGYVLTRGVKTDVCQVTCLTQRS